MLIFLCSRLAVAFNSISTVRSGFNVFSSTFNRVASRQKQYRAANRENFQKIFHSLSPTARANHPPFDFRYFENGCSQRSFRCTGVTLAEAFKMIARMGENERCIASEAMGRRVDQFDRYRKCRPSQKLSVRNRSKAPFRHAPKKEPGQKAGSRRSSQCTFGNVYSAGTGLRPVMKPSRLVPSACTGSCATSLSSNCLVHAANSRQTPSGSKK